MSACPTCGKDVDALRARNVKVRVGKVVAYCSPECLASAESMPVVVGGGSPAGGAAVGSALPRAATPAQGVVKAGAAPDSGPVIEIRYEPVSGVVTSAKDERETPTPTPAPIEKPASPGELFKLEKKGKKADKKADRKADDKANKADKADDKKADDADSKPSEKRPVLKIIETAGGTPKDVTALKDPAPAKATGDGESTKLSAAVVSGAAELPKGARRLGRATLDRDSSNVKQSDDWLDDEPANLGAVRAETDLGEVAQPRSSGKRALVVLLVLALLAAAGVLAYKFVYLKRGAAANSARDMVDAGSQLATTPTDAKSEREPQLAPPKPTAEQIKTRAIGVLRGYLETRDSPRVQRVAAAALARTGDKAAIERLAVALQRDKLEEAGRLEVAYALARAGDKRGLDAIVASLAAPRRDDKLIAGRLLVQLGDTRAVNTLAAYLEIPQHRLGTAEWLARLGEPRAIKVLEQIRTDTAAQPDDKARAVIALSHADKSGLGEELRGLLVDPHFNVYAAEALAKRRDEAARPVLVKLLDVSSLRVGAARALRTLSPAGDQMPYVTALVAALDDPDKQRDTEQIPIAEAILLLLGPAGWAERT